jgi:hypothetical protein
MDNPRTVSSQPAAARQLVAILNRWLGVASAREARARQVDDDEFTTGLGDLA